MEKEEKSIWNGPPVWYFAYGSNMKSESMTKRAISPLDVKAVQLPGYYFNFDVFGMEPHPVVTEIYTNIHFQELHSRNHVTLVSRPFRMRKVHLCSSNGSQSNLLCLQYAVLRTYCPLKTFIDCYHQREVASCMTLSRSLRMSWGRVFQDVEGKHFLSTL